MILDIENPSFCRPTKMEPVMPGVSKLMPVCRTSQASFALSYMKPADHVTFRPGNLSRPLNSMRKSRILKPVSRSGICCSPAMS